MKKLFVALFASASLLAACGGSSGSITNLTVEEFASTIKDSSVVVLDVRTPEEFSSGHIAGAVNMDFQSGNFEQEVLQLDKSKTYAVYCRSGNRSGQATAIMADNGFSPLFNLSGGMNDWSAAGLPVVYN
jgi:rhodanese-related sulfurtransferase